MTGLTLPTLTAARLSRLVGSAMALSLLTGGCASMKNTPEQDAVWDAARACEHVHTGYKVDQVYPDGRYHVWGTTNSTTFQPFFECMSQQLAAQRQARLASGRPRDLVYRAYFIAVAPPSGYLASAPARVETFKADSPITFYLNLYQSGRVLQARFKWYGPDGTLVDQQNRVLRDPTGSTQPNVWYAQVLASARVKAVGRWAMEFYLNEELIDRYDLTVTP